MDISRFLTISNVPENPLEAFDENTFKSVASHIIRGQTVEVNIE